MIFRLLLLTILIYPAHAQEKRDYIWPTNASNHLTSSFCEYRPGHYHSAIDIKTWNKEGYPVYAISDASIYKIRVSPFGYGKVIYLLLDDGNYAVYAHLQKFNAELDQKVRNIQMANKRYTLNWMPDSLRVKKGDVLGFTGQTGIGSPHLHFEIRDPYERPLNPLLFYNRVKDTRAPVLKSLLVIPIKPESRVNGSPVEQIFPLKQTKFNVYKIQDSIRIKGPVGLAITGYDKADGVSNKFAFYKTILKINNVPVFHQQYDMFDFAISEQIDIEIFYPQKVKNNEVYHKLYIESYNQLPFYDRRLGNGLITLNESDKEFLIKVSDFSGNISTVIGNLEKDFNDLAKLHVIRHSDQSFLICLHTPYNLKSLDFYSGIDQSDWIPVSQFEIIERKLENENQIFKIKLNLPDSLHKQIKANIISNNREQSLYGSIDDTIIQENINLNIRNIGESLLLDFSPVGSLNGFNLNLENNSQKYLVTPENINSHLQYVVNSSLFDSSPLKIRLFNHNSVYIDTTILLQKLMPNKYQQISFFDDSVKIISRPQSVYDTLLFDVNRLEKGEFNYDVLLLSPLYNFNSAYQALKHGVDMKVMLDSVKINPKQIGLYTIDRKNRLELLESEFDSSNYQVTGKLEAFGLYFIAADTLKPELELINPKNMQTLKSLESVRFMAKDDQSGIGTDTNISITVDNQFVLPEWDPERDIITGHLHWKLESGEHTIGIGVWDKAGNNNLQKFTFIVE